ncbi:hypothetical protein [Deinococcus humi]|uniref:Uncharacterized protein n=1 Tax=Deinococcus humi TaxID=662880 RepID=A0A7W8JUZ4_9DEIO|nr:hypothetical protein [Deinococcus humi]MBB5363619.1 hypothetical protein [Deinococcus humi]
MTEHRKPWECGESSGAALLDGVGLEPVSSKGAVDLLSGQMAGMVQPDLVSTMLVPARSIGVLVGA